MPANEPEIIRQQMEETRSSLAGKLESLEQQVVQTVQDATSAVTDTVENVKEAVQGTVESVKGSVQETVETVKETFDLNRQMEQHPWLVVGGSVAAGFLVGRMYANWEASQPGWSEPRAFRPRGDGRAVSHIGGRHGFAAEEPGIGSRAAPARPSWLSGIFDSLQPELDRLKGLALGTLFGLVRDSLVQAAPDPLRPKLAGVLSDMSAKLGGEPIKEPLVR